MVFIWIAFGIVCALAAPPRGRNPWGWLALGILFGPFAIVALLVMEKLPVESDNAP